MLPASAPHPDELLSSAVTRCCRQFRLSMKALLKQLGAADASRFSFFSVSLVPQLAAAFGLPPKEVVWKHTMLPYATACSSDGSWERLLETLAHSAPVPSAALSKLQHATLGVIKKRFCEACLADDLKNFGDSYWHRSHHLPASWVCTKHLKYLSYVNLETRIGASQSYLLPHEMEALKLLDGQVHPVVARVSQTSVAALQRGPGPGGLFDSQYFRLLAAQKNWYRHERLVDAATLSQAMNDNLPADFLAESGIVKSDGRADWPALLARPAHGPFSPVKYFLMEALLDEGSPPDQQVPRAHPGRRPASRALMDAAAAKDAKRTLRELLRGTQRMSLKGFLTKAGCWQVYRHHRTSLLKLQAVVEVFRQSGVNSRFKR